jgi:hypothetical protein
MRSSGKRSISVRTSQDGSGNLRAIILSVTASAYDLDTFALS